MRPPRDPPHGGVSTVTVAFRLVYRAPSYAALACVAFLAMAWLLLWSGEVLVFASGSVHLLIEPLIIAPALVIAILFGLLLPMQVFAFRLAAATARQTGSTALGAALGTASMTCCTPVILPSLLSLLGFSGATILSFNLLVHRWWLPLAALSIVLLAYSLSSVVHSLELECQVQNSSGSGGSAVKA